MAQTKTLLDGVNEVLKRVKYIQGDSGSLSTLTDSARQPSIDIAVQVWNEAIAELYSVTNRPMPQELAEGNITLVLNDRDYALAVDLNQLRWPLHDETNGMFIEEYPSGYIGLVSDQIQPANHTGLPFYGAIRETDGEIYLDTLPTASEVGRVYKYRYDRDLEMIAAADTFPFKDAVFRALVPAVALLWERDRKRDFDAGIFRTMMGQAARYLTQKQMRSSWLPR